MTDVRTLEMLTRVAPLGLRFWDPLDAAVVSDGLDIAIWPAGRPEMMTRGVPNRSGVFTFHGLSGLREVENGSGDDAFWAAHPPRHDFTLQVRDLLGRFVPLRKTVRLPVRGVPEAVPLFSAPARVLASPMAVIRARLFDIASNAPAAWALVEARFDGAPAARGLADERGSLLLPMPYPEANAGPRFGSPFAPQGTKLADQAWAVALAFHYAPWLPVPAAPDLDRVLAQPRAVAWEDEGFAAPLERAVLRFGRELVLRTDAAASPPAPLRPNLWITPAGSPP